MIDIKTLSADWIAERRTKYGKDPNLMESMIYALYLLEQLKLTGLEFIFKGGTSLILLMKEPKRFSVDIDIIVSPQIGKEELEKSLSKIPETSAFIRMELDERRSYQGDIPKAHYILFTTRIFPIKIRKDKLFPIPKEKFYWTFCLQKIIIRH